MFSLKSLIFIRRSLNTTNLNFTRIRELRRIVKSFESLSTGSNFENISQQNIPNCETSIKVPAPSSSSANPFKHKAETSSKFSEYESNDLQRDFDEDPFDLVADENLKSPRYTLPSPLAPVDTENPPDLAPNFPPTFNLAAYVDKSETLQKLIHLGVDLSKIEKRKGLPQFLLKLDFEKDMKLHLMFLTDIGVPANQLGEFLTKNPLIFKEDLGDLEVRVNYLEVKNFQRNQISRIVAKNPFWLMFSTKRIDNRLGYFQKNFGLSGDDIRFLTTKQPKLITYSMEHIRQSTFCIREEMGFDRDEVKCLLLSKPKLWMMDSKEVVSRFDYIHRTMNISHDQIVKCPDVLTSRLFRIKERHGFLKSLGKAQYDPTKELYVSLKRLVEGTDKDFVINIAKSSMEEYNTYLRSL